MEVSILVFTPTYNEKVNITRLVPLIREQLPQAHVLVVDDNSPDGTGEVVRQFAAQDSQVHLLHREKKEGLGRAYLAGMQWGLEHEYDLIIQMDADLSHDPERLPELVEKARDADVAIGSRYIPGGGISNWPIHRRMLSRFANVYVRSILGLTINDSTSGYRCWRRDVLESMDLEAIRSNGYAFLVEMIYMAHSRGFRIAEIPIIFTDRVEGTSKIGREVILESVIMPWKIRFGCREAKPGFNSLP